MVPGAGRLVSLIVFLMLFSPVAAKAALPGDTNNDGIVSISEVRSAINAYLGLIKLPSPVGVWRSTNGAEFIYLVLFSDKSFLYAENDLEAVTAAENGLEVGTYTNDAANMNFNITYDDNAPGHDSGVGDIGTPSVIDYSFSTDGNTLTVAGGQVVLNRVTFNSSSMVGVWRSVNGAEFSYLILFADNTFLYAENDLQAVSPEENGVEVGTYTVVNNRVTFNVIYDDNAPGQDSGVGDVGIPAVYDMTLSADGATLSVAGELTWTRAF